MPELALLAQWTLALLLTVSGLAKLSDRADTAAAFAAFGVAEKLRWTAPLLPLVELGLAVALVVPASARWGALGSLALLGAFSAAIAVNLARGRRPDCNCFGRLGGGPIGRGTLVRNGVLMALAAIATLPSATPAELGAWVSPSAAWAVAAVAVLGVALAGLVWLVLELWRQQARLLLRLDALEAAVESGHSRQGHDHGGPLGSGAPEATGTDASGSAISLSQLWPDGDVTLLAFTDPACAACAPLYPELAAWQATPGRRRVVVVTRAETSPHPDLGLFTEADRAASIAYGVRGTPSAVLVDAQGRLVRPVAEGADAIRALLGEPVPATPAGPESGAGSTAANPPRPVPTRIAPRPARAGKVAPVAGLERFPANATPGPGSGRSELLLFWNEHCSHCRAMISALDHRAEHVGAAGPTLTFVVTSPDQARTTAERMAQASALVDAEMRLSLALGVPGTPSAALVDSAGRLVADLAVGPDAVLALLDGATTRSEAAPRRP